jgi:hypothetical protein
MSASIRPIKRSRVFMRLVILSFTSLLVLVAGANHHPFYWQTQSCAADGEEARVCNRQNKQATHNNCCEGLVCSWIFCVEPEGPSSTSSHSPSVSPTVSPPNTPPPTPLECADPCITVDETIEYQTFYGAGASLTKSSAAVLDGVSDGTRTEMLEALFSRDTGIGLRCSASPWARPISA